MRTRPLAGRTRAFNAASLALLVALVALSSVAPDAALDRARAQPNTASAGDRLDANDAQARDAAFERLGITGISPVTWMTKRALAQRGQDGEALTGGIVILGVAAGRPLADAGVDALTIVTALRYTDDGTSRTVALGSVRNVHTIITADRAFADWHHADAADLTLVVWRDGAGADVDVFASGSDPAAKLLQAAHDAHAQGDLDAALKLTEQLIADHPLYPATHLLRATIHIERGDFEAAIADASRAIALDPTLADAYAKRAQAHETLGDHQQAITDLSESLRLDPTLADAWRNRGRARARLGDLRGAIADVDRAIELDPADADAFQLRAAIYAGARHFENALADINRALELSPDNAEAWLTRAQVHAALGKLQDSLADLNRAIELAPEIDRAYAMRAELYRHLGDLDAALADITLALDLNPQTYRYWRFRGTVWLQIERYQEAFEDFSQAIELEPGDATTFALRARASVELGRYEHALADLDTAIAMQPDRADILALRGRVLHRLGQLDEAVETLDRALAIDPDNADAHYERAECLFKAGRPDEARYGLESYLRLRPEDVRAWRLRAEINIMLGDTVSAQADFERALDLEPDAVETLVDYASLLAAMDQTDAAEAAFDRALDACITDEERELVSAAREAAMPTPAPTPDAWNEDGEAFATDNAASEVLTPMIDDWGEIPFSLAIIANVPAEFADLPLGLDKDGLRVAIRNMFADYGADAVGPPERGHYLKLSLMLDYPKERTSSMLGTVINVAVLVYLRAELVNGDQTKDLGTFLLYSFVTADTHEDATERAVGERMLRQLVARVIKLWHPE